MVGQPLFIVCPRSIDPFYEVTYYIKWVTTSWTHSTCSRKTQKKCYILWSKKSVLLWGCAYVFSCWKIFILKETLTSTLFFRYLYENRAQTLKIIQMCTWESYLLFAYPQRAWYLSLVGIWRLDCLWIFQTPYN